MLPAFAATRFNNTPEHNFDQLELEQNQSSLRKGMLQTTQPFPVIGCK